jgi:hypothetical protein
LDGLSIENSKRLLLTLMGQCKNSGMSWKGNMLHDAGHGPVITEDVKGELFIGDAYTIRALAPDGTSMPVVVNKGVVSLKKHIFYEIIGQCK